MNFRPAFALLLGATFGVASLSAWDYEGHRIVNQIALAALPPDFPDFVRDPAVAERIAFLGGEPDRWRNVPDLPARHYNSPDHFIDFEDITAAGVPPAEMSDLRQVFAQQLAAARVRAPDKFPVIDPAKNADRTRELVGFLPWAITEYYGRLRSGFSYLKAFEEVGTPVEVENAKANIIYMMGVMGHYVGDGAQPLHTTKHFNGWVGENPLGYTTWPGLHAWIDGGFNNKTGLKLADLAARVKTAAPISLAPRPDGRDPIFAATLDYLLVQHAQVEPLYALDKAGKLKADTPTSGIEGRAFIDGQLLQGGQMLATIWLTAWRAAIPDTYLRAQLYTRKVAAAPVPAATPAIGTPAPATAPVPGTPTPGPEATIPSTPAPR